MDKRKVKVLEGELDQLKSDFEENISDFQNQFVSVHKKMNVKFTVVEDMPKKLLEAKPNTATSKAKEANIGQGRGRKPNPFRGGENQEVKILEGGDGMPPLEPISREKRSIGYERSGVDFVRRGENYECRGADFERRRGDFEEGFRFEHSSPLSSLCAIRSSVRKSGEGIYPEASPGSFPSAIC
ncbi:hypothetical protein M5K25_025360 [Dendrobium thyrsiflorum]|uniref:Uncharacterized protein n=1 Tax=Dendrobium thyrsiflorum TaxID=117978 RepID=A0ABD0U487_DENTH